MGAGWPSGQGAGLRTRHITRCEFKPGCWRLPRKPLACALIRPKSLWQNKHCSLPLCTIYLAKQSTEPKGSQRAQSLPAECKLDDNGSTCSTKAHYCTVPGGSSLVDMILCSNGCGGPQSMPRRDGASSGPTPHWMPRRNGLQENGAQKRRYI